MARTTNKRIRLIEAAKILIHQQGFSLTTLADIAQKADVPLGNVYYYFKTKEAIGEAVIERISVEIQELLGRFDAEHDPSQRLQALINHDAEYLELVARFGCPVGGLCQELGKQGGSLADQAAKLLHDILKWAESQFKLLGFGEASERHALNLLASIQGNHLLTHTFKDPNLGIQQAKNLQESLSKVLADARSSIGSTARQEEVVY